MQTIGGLDLLPYLSLVAALAIAYLLRTRVDEAPPAKKPPTTASHKHERTSVRAIKSTPLTPSTLGGKRMLRKQPAKVECPKARSGVAKSDTARPPRSNNVPSGSRERNASRIRLHRGWGYYCDQENPDQVVRRRRTGARPPPWAKSKMGARASL